MEMGVLQLCLLAPLCSVLWTGDHLLNRNKKQSGRQCDISTIKTPSVGTWMRGERGASECQLLGVVQLELRGTRCSCASCLPTILKYQAKCQELILLGMGFFVKNVDIYPESRR